MSNAGLLLAASMLLVGLMVAAMMLLAADRQSRRISTRQEQLISQYRLVLPPVSTRQRAMQALRAPAAREAIRRLLGMDPLRSDPYPLKLWIVLPLALAAGYAAQWLLHGVLGAFAWLLLPTAALIMIRQIYKGADAKRVNTIYRQFPDALAMIVRAVRVGIPVTEALWAVSRDAEQPTAALFGKLYDQVGIGTSLEDALRDLAERTHVPEYRFFATALSLQSQTGGGLTETLENLADVIRKRVALKARGFALAAEARTSAAVLAVLPVFSGIALMVLDPAYLMPLFREKQGQAVLGCTVVWLCLGVLSMRTLIRKSLA
ncbi:type II secretion system F family protein [Lichenicoccus sp.]|uniref:type II secretion system F family protein n=1 Tax=Lichenicoccus sp. TaxID=2781899 RepID=UPI003D116B1A